MQHGGIVTLAQTPDDDKTAINHGNSRNTPDYHRSIAVLRTADLLGRNAADNNFAGFNGADERQIGLLCAARSYLNAFEYGNIFFEININNYRLASAKSNAINALLVVRNKCYKQIVFTGLQITDMITSINTR